MQATKILILTMKSEPETTPGTRTTIRSRTCLPGNWENPLIVTSVNPSGGWEEGGGGGGGKGM